MTSFDKKLNMALHSHKMDTGKKVYQIADEAGINRQSLYSFTGGNSSLNAENTKKLLDYLNLSVELKSLETVSKT